MGDIIKIDIISDVVCPWCIIGYKRLEQAISEMGIEDNVEVEWHPFELNSDMPAEGEGIQKHLFRKYSLTPEQSLSSLIDMSHLGAEVGFTLDFLSGQKMVNTRDAHILLALAKESGKQTELKIRLFEAYFSEQKDVSDQHVLVQELQRVGVNVDEALARLNDTAARQRIVEQEDMWRGRGIVSVPTMIFNDSTSYNGAQSINVYKQVLRELLEQ